MKQEKGFYERAMRYALGIKPEDSLTVLDGLGDAIDVFVDALPHRKKIAFTTFFDGSFASAIEHFKAIPGAVEELKNSAVLGDEENYTYVKEHRVNANPSDDERYFYGRLLYAAADIDARHIPFELTKEAVEMAERALNSLPLSENTAIRASLSGYFAMVMMKFRNPIRFKKYRSLVEYDREKYDY